MHSSRVEARVRQAIESKRKGPGGEDDFIEFKRDWPEDTKKFARQLAGSLNRAGSEPVLVIIGVDDRTGAVTNPPAQDMSNWWPAVTKHFNQVQPEIVKDIGVQVDEDSFVHALVISSDRAPYVFATGADPTRFEIPIREGTRTVTARRDQIMRMLVPAVELPTIHILEASFTAVTEHEVQDFDGANLQEDAMLVRGGIELFVEAGVGTAAMFPRYAIAATAKIGEQVLDLYSDHGASQGGTPVQRAGVTDSPDGYVVAGAGSCFVSLRTSNLAYEHFARISSYMGTIEIRLILRMAGANTAARGFLAAQRRDEVLDDYPNDDQAVSARWRYWWRTDGPTLGSQ